MNSGAQLSLNNKEFYVKLIDLNKNANGKDKIYRTIQYGSRLLVYLFLKRISKINENQTIDDGSSTYVNSQLKLKVLVYEKYAKILKRLEDSMSSTRKVLRLAKSLEMIMNFIELTKKPQATRFLLYLLRLSYVNQALYLIMDNLNWLLNSIIQVNEKSTGERNKDSFLMMLLKNFNYNYYSNLFWMNTSVLGLIKNGHDLVMHYNTELALKRDKEVSDAYTYKTSSPSASNSSTNATVVKRLKRVKVFFIKFFKFLLLNYTRNPKSRRLLNIIFLEMFKNSLDLLLPMANLNLIKLTTGKQGLFGLISSLISIYLIF